VLQSEIRNLDEANYREIRSVHRDVLHNRALIRDVNRSDNVSAMERVPSAEPEEPAE
jgi:hypothetical protein